MKIRPEVVRHLTAREWLRYASLGLIAGVDPEHARALPEDEYTAIRG